MKRVIGLSAAVAGLLISASGSAAVVPVSVIIDLNGPKALLSANGFSLAATAAALASPVAIKDGDTLQLTINFAGTETVKLTGASSLTTRFQNTSGSSTTPTLSTGTLTLIGSPGTSDQVARASQDSSSSYIDADTQYGTLADPATFSGLLWQGTVDYTDFADSLGTTRLFDTASFTLFADNVTISGSAPSVPEPATWAMMVIGFGAVGAGLRSRRSTSVKFA